MLHKFLQAAFERHVNETLPIINQLKDSIVMSRPFEEGRLLGDIILHMLRSIEYYSRGLGEGKWEPLAYSLKEYEKADAIKGLTNEVFTRAKQYIAAIDPDSLMREITHFNQPATVAEIFHEMIEHSIHHRGQLIAYYRLLGIKPNEIEYII
jgi:uncharacterized damage-inducible protein DinB